MERREKGRRELITQAITWKINAAYLDDSNPKIWSVWRLLLVRMHEFVCKSKRRGGRLTGIWTSKAGETSWLAEIQLKYTCFHWFSPRKGWRNRPPLSLRFAPCAYFTHTAPGVRRRLDPSVRADDGTPAAELRSATLGASLLDEIIQKIISSLLSLLHFPKKKTRLRKSVSRMKVSIRPLQNHSKKYPSVLRTNS